MDSHCGPLCFSESGPTDSHCGLKLYCTVLQLYSTVQYCTVLRYSRAKSGVADSHCGVKLGAENSLSGLKHCVSSSKTTVLLHVYSRSTIRIHVYMYTSTVVGFQIGGMAGVLTS